MTLMLSTLVIVAVLMASTVLAQAAEAPGYQISEMKADAATAKRIRYAAAVASAVRNVPSAAPFALANYADDGDLEDLEAVDIDEVVREYESLPDKPPPSRCIWILLARGSSWREGASEATDEAPGDMVPMGMRLAARRIWAVEDWALYKVFRGAVAHGEEGYPVEGYALLKDGSFWMKLRGEGIELEAVGRVHGGNAEDASGIRRCRSLCVRMKGEMAVDGGDYLFGAWGRAFRLCLRAVEPANAPEAAPTRAISA